MPFLHFLHFLHKDTYIYHKDASFIYYVFIIYM